LSDYREQNLTNTNFEVADTDGDGLSDGEEVEVGTNPLVVDTDEDGYSDSLEFRVTLTDPLVASAGKFEENLLVSYSFNNGNAANGGSLNDGTVVGGTTFVDGRSGLAFQGNRTGANDAYIQTGYSGTDLGFGPDSVYTAMAWVNWSGASGQTDHVVFGQEDGAGNASQLHHGIRADSEANVHYGGWGNDINDAGTATPGEWTHLAWSYDGTDKVVFVNGVETARQNGGTMAGHALPVIVGGHGRDAASQGVPEPFSLGLLTESLPTQEAVVDAASGLSGDPSSYIYQWYFEDTLIPSSEGGSGATYNINGIPQNEGTWKVLISDREKIYEKTFRYRIFVDTDDDGLSDYREQNITGTNFQVLDTDSDGLNDGEEVNLGSDPLLLDTDEDGIQDGAESGYGTSPLVADTDLDGNLDGAEVAEGSDPLSFGFFGGFSARF
jgi:hypothetical protein